MNNLDKRIESLPHEDLLQLVTWGQMVEQNPAETLKSAEFCKHMPADFPQRLRMVGAMFDLSSSDWLLVSWYMYFLVLKESIPDADKLRVMQKALGRTAAQPLPQLLCWTEQGVQLSPVCRDFFLHREPQLPVGACIRFCHPQPVYHDETVIQQAAEFATACAQQTDPASAVVLLWGEKGTGRDFLARQIAGLVTGAVLCIDPAVIALEDVPELIRASLLYNALPYITNFTPAARPLLDSLSRQIQLCLLRAETPQLVPGYLIFQRQVTGFTQSQRADAMQALFAPDAPPDTDWNMQAQRYRLPPALLRQASERMRAERLCTPPARRWQILQDILRESDVPEFSGSAQLLESSSRLDDVILPEAQRKKLDILCSFVKQHTRLYQDWGFDQKISYGKGVSALFYGASGTGKTLAATALANELGMPLYRVDLSQLTSKYIGETQKNIGRIFEKAQKSGCILFFDEADALFSRRSEVTDAQDKYANGEIAYLLQQTEQYQGVTLLATNLLQNFDEAFRRRITFMIRFPMPDVCQRERMWRNIFPPQAPCQTLNFPLLAQSFELSGAGIRNSAVYAAFLALQENQPIGMHHILNGVKNEYEKLGKMIDPQLEHFFKEEGAHL